MYKDKELLKQINIYLYYQFIYNVDHPKFIRTKLIFWFSLGWGIRLTYLKYQITKKYQKYNNQHNFTLNQQNKYYLKEIQHGLKHKKTTTNLTKNAIVGQIQRWNSWNIQ